MADNIKLEVTTPRGRALEVDSASVQVPGLNGEFGLLAGHLPILAALKPGVMRYEEGGQHKQVAIGGGFAEGDAVHLRIITEFFEVAGDVDAADAKKDLEEADARLKAFKGEFGDPAHREALRNLQWAQARLDLLAGTKN